MENAQTISLARRQYPVVLIAANAFSNGDFFVDSIAHTATFDSRGSDFAIASTGSRCPNHWRFKRLATC